MQESNEMNNAGTIRLLTFIALLAGCVFICFYFGSNISKISGFLSMRSAAELEQYLTSISEDLTPLILFASYYIKSFGIGFYVVALVICSLVTLIATMIVFLIFRCVSIRRTSYVSESEYKLTKYLFFAVFILSTIVPVFFYGFKSLIWSPFLNFAWFLSALVYSTRILYLISHRYSISRLITICKISRHNSKHRHRTNISLRGLTLRRIR